MDLLSKHTDYAVQAIACIAKHEGQKVSASEISARLGLPRPFMRKILQQMQNAGILFSTKGSGGGFALAKAPEKIMLTDIIELFQGKISFSQCLLRRKICPNRKTCRLRKKLLQIEDSVIAQLSGTTLAELIK